MNGQVEVTWRKLLTVAQSLMVHVRVPESYVHFALIYMTDNIFLVVPIKDIIKEDGYQTTPLKLATGTKPSVSHLHVLFCPYVVQKSTAHVETKTLNMHHQAQKGFHCIFVGIPEHQKGYLVYVPTTRKIICSYDVVFDKKKSSALAYTPQPYSEAMAMLPAIMYTPYGTSLREQAGNITMFTQFEKGNILTKTRNDAESSDEYDNESIMISKQYMITMNSGDESNHDIISIEMLLNICDRSQTHPNVNRRKERYKICDYIRQRQFV